MGESEEFFRLVRIEGKQITISRVADPNQDNSRSTVSKLPENSGD